ncbi:MAG TPA: DUF1549 and DUF1553 domain-containing protein [Planctomycetota bacterium]|nr:DUF1549 and DUF1553 domain-containing protein [Planctomycetota bacterium]
MRHALPLALLALLASSGSARNEDAVPPALSVYPAEIELSTSRDRQSFVVQLTRPDGVTRDVTDEAKVSLAHPFAELKGNVLTPAADGETEMTVTAAGRTVKVKVAVKDSKADRPISFKLDVMPVFMRSGCNTGACHGAARGKDGFRISLFGFDPDGDYHRLTREMSGRRISVAMPEECLLVEKSTGIVNHTGGERFKPKSELYDTLIRWLDKGAPKDAADVATPVSLELYPPKLVMEGEGAAQRMTVRAKYSDGSDRDVTPLARFMTNNDVSAKIDEDGRVTAGKRGEAYVFARFATFTVGSQAIVIPKGVKYAWSDVPEKNYVDTLVFDKLKKLRMFPSEICSDEVFLRRASLDLTGQLPGRAEYDRFASDARPDKREKLIDEFLARKEFSELWVMKWAELLQIRTDDNRQVSYKTALGYFNWLQARVEDNVPFNEIVRDLLSSNGGTFQNPPSTFYQIGRETLKTSENVAQIFMGMRIQCAQCHNHPFDRWTMDDYYGFAAFFSQVGRKNAEDPRERIIFDRGEGEVRHPVGGRTMAPKFLGGDVPDVKGHDRRQVLAEWIASPRNPYFARNVANIVWAHFFGQGVIDPVDDVRVSNPPSNPELLDALARKLTDYKYDFKKFVRDICTSRSYQLSTRGNETNEADSRNFAKGPIRRIRAEVLLDIISQVTETPNKFRGLPLGARAVQIADGNVSNYFLKTFGRASRETVCSCEVKMDPNLSQALHLLNGDTVNQRIAQGGVVGKLLASGKSPEDVVEELYIRCVGRKPTAAQIEKVKPLDKATARQDLEDVFWALLNANEFIFNH